MSEESTSALVTTKAQAVATLDVRDASAQALALMEERVANQKKMLAIAVKLTAPDQWTVFAGTDKVGVYRETIYPTGGAADTILRRAFGLTWSEKEITVQDTPDGKLATCSAWLMSGKERVEHFTGYRMMGGYIKTEADLRRSVLENMKSVAVRDLLGLRFRSPAEIKELGLDVTRLERRAEFQSHDTDPNTATIPFGRDKGKPITDVDDSSLKWVAESIKKSIDDPAKSKWKSKNETLLTALRDEHKRRHAAPPPEAESPPVPDVDFGPPQLTDEEVASMEREREPGEEG